jgi:hypothetical protein
MHMANKGLFASAVAKLLPRADAVNREGAPAYAYGPEAKLAQIGVLSGVRTEGVGPCGRLPRRVGVDAIAGDGLPQGRVV